MTAEEYQQEAQRLRPALIETAQRYLSSADDAEDAVQEALLKLWTLRCEVRQPMDGLAHVVTRNICLTMLRRRQTRAVEVTIDGAGNPQTGPPLAMDGDDEMLQRVERLLQVIDQLPGLQQLVLRLRHFEGMEMGEIARLTGCSEVAVRKTLSRARQAVKARYLADNDGTDESHHSS